MGIDQLFGKSYVLSNIAPQPSNVFEQFQQVHTYYQAKNGELCAANNELKSRLSYVEQALASEIVLRSAATSHLRDALEKLKDSQELVDTLKKQCQKHQEDLDEYQSAEASKQHILENANNGAQNLIEIEKDPSEPDLQRTIRQQQSKITQFKDQLIATINYNRILNKELERLESTSDIHNLHKSVTKELTSLRAELTQQTTNVGMLCNQLQTMVQCNDELRAVLSGHNAIINEMIQPFKDVAVSKEGRRFLKEFEIECTHGGRKLDLTCLVRMRNSSNMLRLNAEEESKRNSQLVTDIERLTYMNGEMLKSFEPADKTKHGRAFLAEFERPCLKGGRILDITALMTIIAGLRGYRDQVKKELDKKTAEFQELSKALKLSEGRTQQTQELLIKRLEYLSDNQLEKWERTLEAEEMLKTAQEDLKALKADMDKLIIEKKTLEEDYIIARGVAKRISGFAKEQAGKEVENMRVRRYGYGDDRDGTMEEDRGDVVAVYTRR
ncbi:hypothetical protein FPQ18DRAFT_405071 [Pyronema domesticum]|nr:hypothetical protein FPQ18DRAFT_405071 [Pyronema domesticum]